MTTTAPPPDDFLTATFDAYYSADFKAQQTTVMLATVPGYAHRREALTPRCQQVADLLVLGKTPAAIGEALGIKPDTVRNHMKACYERTGTRNRPTLTAFLLLGVRQ